MLVQLLSRYYERLSIRRKFLLSTVLPIVLVFTAFLPFFLQVLEQSAESRIEANRTALVSLNSTGINRAFAQLASVAEMNAKFVQLTPEISEDTIYELLNATLENNEYIYGATVAFSPFEFDAQRRLFSPYVFRGGNGLSRMDIGDLQLDTGYDYTSGNWEWWSKPLATRESSWTLPYYDAGAGNIFMISYTVPVWRDDKVVAVASIDLDLNSIFDALGTMADGFDAIVDKGGRWIHNPLASSTSRGIADLETQFDRETIDTFLQEVEARRSGRIRAVRHTLPDNPNALIQDRVIWWYYAPIATTEWSYLYFQSENQVLAAAREQWRLLAMLFGFVVLLVVMLVWIMASRLTAPILALHSAAQKASEGNYDVVVQSHRKDELGKLASVFNKMAASMKSRKEDLEREVNLRTHKLQESQQHILAKNKELQIAMEAAEAAAEAKANFLAVMSHEIRTPMNGILGMVELMSHSNVNEEQRHMISTIHSSGQALLTILNDILDLSKIEAGKLELESVQFSIQELVEGTAETLIQPAALKGLRLATFIDPHIPSQVLGDPVRVRQILINLIGNAVKFSEKGEVSVEVEWDSSASADDRELLLKFTVRDQGIGIAPDIQAQLFQPFVQAESSTTRRFGGTGLGLSICQRLALMMNGHIRVNSSPGVGSEFVVSIPFQASSGREKQSSRTGFHGIRILLLAMSAMEAKASQEYLGYWGAEVTTLSTEQELTENTEALRTAKLLILGTDLSPEEQTRCAERLMSVPKAGHLRFGFLQQGRGHGVKPVNDRVVVLDTDLLLRAQLVQLVAVTLGFESPEVAHSTFSSTTRYAVPTVEEAQAHNCLILVAEDNPTNRDVIGRQLALLGYACEMAEDGDIAFKAWESGRYSLLLTDCHMPNRDGFSLTALIREKEQEAGHHLPIVAITANAMAGEAEKCLAAGMDDYMAKPVEMKLMAEKLSRWLPHYTPIPLDSKQDQLHSDAQTRKAEEHKNAPVVEQSSASPVDDKVLKAIFGDDADTFRDIMRDFVSPTWEIINEIANGFEENSVDAVVKASHKLKSSARSVGATTLADLCVAMEQAGKAGNLDIVRDNVPQLKVEMEAIERYVQAL